MVKTLNPITQSALELAVVKFADKLPATTLCEQFRFGRGGFTPVRVREAEPLFGIPVTRRRGCLNQNNLGAGLFVFPKLEL